MSESHSETIEIPPLLYEQLLAHLQAELPYEGFGLLAGREGNISHIFPMMNVERSPDRYFCDPRELFFLHRYCRSRGLEWRAIYHSHPKGKSYPSRRDLEQCFYPELVYVIVGWDSPDRPEAKAFRIQEGVAAEVEIIRTG